MREQEESPSKLPDWREGVAILIERAWLGVLVAVCVFLVFVLQARRQIPYYRSSATLLIEAQTPRIMNFQDMMSYNLRTVEYFNTHIKALHSRSIMEKALELTGLMDRPGFIPQAATREARIEALQRAVSIAPIERSRLITISVEHSDPQIASDLANAVGQAYIQQEMEMRMGTSMQAIEWLRDRADEFRTKLEEGLLQLQEYREQTGSVSLEEDQDIVVSKLKALNTALTQAQTERIQAQTQWQAVQQQMDAGTDLTRIAPMLNDPGVQQLLRRLQEQQQEVARLQQRYREHHPDMQQVLELERTLRAQFDQACADAVHALKSNYEIRIERERNLQEALREQEREAFELDRKLVRYNELKRNIEADQSIHQAVIARMREASMTETLPGEIIRLVEEARPAKVPFRPRPGQAVFRGLVFGSVLGVVAIFLFYYADHRFRRNEEVERVLGIPVLATIPMVSGKSVQERGMAAHLKASSEEAECFRTLRASLLLKQELRQSPILMVTSSGPGDGKSLVATNLAISLAQDGRKVLLVGCDLRRPVQAKIFGLPKGSPGLSDVLKGQARWTDAIHREVVPNLDVLASGHVPSQPSELLGKQVFARFLGEVRESYAHVIVDAPPILGVSDSLVLLPNMDGVLFVVRYGTTHSLGAKHAMLKLQASGVACIGSIMNGVNLKSVANYYYYRRYGGYAYRQYKAHAATQPADG